MTAATAMPAMAPVERPLLLTLEGTHWLSLKLNLSLHVLHFATVSSPAGASHVAQFSTPTYCLSPVRVTPVVSEHGITDCSVALAFGAAK
eukprot:XP_001708277.1 Hypothetical protein GL50803_118607 [Giardia lamblia ATCC 50803]